MDAGAMNPVSGVVRALENVVKKEVEEKPEMVECAVCLERCTPGADLRGCTTAGTPLLVFLAKFSRNDDINITRQLCHTCLHLINDLEQAELEYIKVKDTFEAIIRNNPMFNQCSNSLDNVKVEIELNSFVSHDSEDEPLAVTKKKRNQKGVKRKKNTTGTAKRGRPRKKSVSKDSSWSCGVCGARSDVGGVAGLTAHQLVAHLHPEGLGKALKKEDSGDGSESSHFNNGLESLKTEIDFGGVDDDDDDDDGVDNYVPDLYNERTKRVVGRPRKIKLIPPQERKRISKTVHKCADCDAKFTSLKRFEQHQEKHHEGKPPFICEVCGARYKHKRACDIHVALHQGISDWKCEECNKLFPSKGALQRHNNIHTGKLNYQCDLCGKSFIHTSSFKMHKLSHSGVKPHACDVCGLALMTRSHLKRHKRVHSGEKRHECPVCGKRFSERYNLAAHSKSHSEAGAPPCPLPPRRRLFRCPYCPERFERRYMLERHAPAAHGTALERAPPTPRNTMSKLLKAQAQARLPPGDATDTKEERSPDSQKLQITSPSPTVTVTAGSWSGVYAAEFGIRHDYAH